MSPADGNFYIPFDPVDHPLYHTAANSRQEPPIACLEVMLADGADCQGWKADRTLDIVWTWVNSSDYVWRGAHAMATQRQGDVSDEPVNDYKAPLAHFRYCSRTIFALIKLC